VWCPAWSGLERCALKTASIRLDGLTSTLANAPPDHTTSPDARDRRVARLKEPFATALWSPNGSRLAVIGRSLHLIDLPGHRTLTLAYPTGGRGSSENFTWAPTSDRLLHQTLQPHRPS
jgi:hypothetical protein